MNKSQSFALKQKLKSHVDFLFSETKIRHIKLSWFSSSLQEYGVQFRKPEKILRKMKSGYVLSKGEGIRLDYQANQKLSRHEEKLLKNFLKIVGLLTEQFLSVQSLDQEKNQFLANIFHEIKTPINGILATLDLIQIQSKDDSLTPLLGIINSSSLHLAEIVHDLLDFSKLHSGKMELEKTSFELSGVLSELKNIFFPIAFKKGISFEVINEVPQSACFTGDPLRLKQVLANLISNAIKFTAIGQVLLRVSQTEGPKSPLLHFRVIDTGIGIPNHSLGRIFQPFMQADSSTTRKYGGTGLGLTITKKFIDLMSGTIRVHSTEGVGSEFQVDIPMALKSDFRQVNTHDAQYFQKLRFRDLHVLLCEDNPINQLVGKEILETLGCFVDVCSNGQEGVEKVQEKEYDLVFMDWRMPIMDGLEATQKIRELDYHGLPIIALTANSTEEDKRICLEAGMSDFVSKPFRLEDISKALDRWSPEVKKIVTSENLQAPKIPLEQFKEDIRRLCHELSDSQITAKEVHNRVHQLKTNLKFIKENSIAQLAYQLESQIFNVSEAQWRSALDSLLMILELKDLADDRNHRGKVA